MTTKSKKTGQFSFKHGYVIFFDLLGFRALTLNNLALDKEAVKPHGIAASIQDQDRCPVLAYSLQWRFRHTLAWCIKNFNAEVFQFSDSAFVYTKSSNDALRATAYVMRQLTCEGCLARAGLAHGRVLDGEDEYSSLGRIILGDAVTAAYERAEVDGKGMAQTVLMSSEVYRRITSDDNVLEDTSFRLVSEGVYALDWTRLPNTFVISASLGPNAHVYEPLAHLLFSGEYNWNCESSAGASKLNAAIDSVSKSISADSRFMFLLLTEDQIDRVVSKRPFDPKTAVIYKTNFYRHADQGELWLP